MDDERLNTLLQLLQQTEVQPPLVSDSRIKAMITNHRMLWIGLPFIASLLVATGIVYVVGPTHQQSVIERPRSVQRVTAPTVTTPEPARVDAGAGASSNASAYVPVRDDSTLDPRSILTLSLTDEELEPFGIRRYADSVTLLIQTLVVADTLRARTLGLTPDQLRDTTLLFHRSYAFTKGRVNTIAANRLSGNVLDELSPIFFPLTTSDKSVGSGTFLVGTTPALISYSLYDTVTYAATTVEPSPLQRQVPRLSFLASLPDERSFGNLSPSRKPILLDISDKSNTHRYIVAVMPTRAVLEHLPERFRAALKTCYAPFIPNIAMPSTILMRERQMEQLRSETRTKLTKVAGVSGHPFIELNNASLRQFGFVTDEVSICNNVRSVATIDTSTTSFVRSSSRRPDNAYLASLRYDSSVAIQRIKGLEFPVGQLDGPIPDAGSSVEVHVSGQVDTVIHCYTSHFIRMMAVDSIPPMDWLDRFPLARKFASDVASEIMNRRIPTDSLGYYAVQHGNQLIPVLKLLFGLRVATPWVSRPGWNGDRRRLVKISWYLPSQRVLSALPENIRQFLQPEYEALYASIEQSQSLSEACNLLNRPSALGFCSIGDTTLRIDGVGPIPARDVLTLYVTSDRDASGTVQIVDGNGNIVQEKSNISIPQGASELPLPIESTLPSGSYMVILSTSSEVRRSRVLISR